MDNTNNQGGLPSTRVERKLVQRARTDSDAKDLSDRVASSSESTAELFASEYSPESEGTPAVNPHGVERKKRP